MVEGRRGQTAVRRVAGKRRERVPGTGKQADSQRFERFDDNAAQTCVDGLLFRGQRDS
jgi:hypothetical protein